MEFKIESAEKEFQELVAKRKQEIELGVRKKVNKLRLWYVLVEYGVLILGYTIICCFVSWQLAIGIWLIQWGNNMAQKRQLYKDDNFWKEIWKF